MLDVADDPMLGLAESAEVLALADKAPTELVLDADVVLAEPDDSAIEVWNPIELVVPAKLALAVVPVELDMLSSTFMICEATSFEEVGLGPVAPGILFETPLTYNAPPVGASEYVVPPIATSVDPAYTGVSPTR